MRTYTAVIERCPDTGLYVGYVPGFRARTHRRKPSTSSTRIFARSSSLLLEDGDPPRLDAEFVGTHTVTIAA